MVFDATSLHPSSMYDEISSYPEIESGYDFTTDLKNEIVRKYYKKIHRM